MKKLIIILTINMLVILGCKSQVLKTVFCDKPPMGFQ